MSDLDDWLESQLPPDGHVPESREPDLDDIVAAIDAILAAALVNVNQITITVTRVEPDKPVTWATTYQGVHLSLDTFGELMSALVRLKP